jgi:hypothetical protein
MKIEYPRWKHHRNTDECLVRNEREEEALGAEWADMPFGALPESEVAKPVDADALALENATLREEIGALTSERATLQAAYDKLLADAKKLQADLKKAKRAAKADEAASEPQQ